LTSPTIEERYKCKSGTCTWCSRGPSLDRHLALLADLRTLVRRLSRSALLLAGQLLDQKPAVKSRSILTLRPPELSGSDAEHLTEVTRQVALVGKPHGIRNLGQ
jgi:hypothetical protein